MSFQGLEDGALDLVLLLAQKLLRGRLEQVRVLHDLDLGHPGHREWHTLGSLHTLAHRVQGHHLEEGKQKRDIRQGSIRYKKYVLVQSSFMKRIFHAQMNNFSKPFESKAILNQRHSESDIS